MDQIVWLLYICFGYSPAAYFMCVKCTISLYFIIFLLLFPVPRFLVFCLQNITLTWPFSFYSVFVSKTNVLWESASAPFPLPFAHVSRIAACSVLWFLLICPSCLKICNSAFKGTQTCTSWCCFIKIVCFSTPLLHSKCKLLLISP